MTELSKRGAGTVRVLVAEDEDQLRAAIRELLEADGRFELVAVAVDADEAVRQAQAHQPEVALLDVRMPGGGGPRAAAGIAAVSPGTRSLALSAYEDRARVLEMLRAGAVGYLVKGMQAEEVVEALLRAARGQSSLPSKLLHDLFADDAPDPDRRFEPLLEYAPDAVVVVDRTGRIVLVNAQTERLFGYSRRELLGEPLETLLPERFRDRHVLRRDEYVAEPHSRPMGLGLELAGRRRDGSEFPADISLSAVETADGPVVAAFVRDDTGRRERVEQERELAARRAVLARVVSAGEEERRQIATDIHDDSIQVMAAAGMRLQILRRSLDDPEHLSRLDELEHTIELSIARLRHLIFELRPPVLDLEGLAAALRMYAADVTAETGAEFELEDRLTSEPPESVRVILYRIAQEVLTNVRKHSAASRVKVRISDRDRGYEVRIEDDGVGFVPELADRRPGHLGLAAIRERAELAGGSFEVESTPGAGTVVEFWIGSGFHSAPDPGLVPQEAREP
jgi:PAS domain S-box-containing protein